jgi:hypothetical protein
MQPNTHHGMFDFRKLHDLVSQWPVSVVAIGIVLTIIWIVIVFWIPVRFLLSA